MLPSLLNLEAVWIPYLHTSWISINHSGGPVPGMWVVLFLGFLRVVVFLLWFHSGGFCFGL